MRCPMTVPVPILGAGLAAAFFLLGGCGGAAGPAPDRGDAPLYFASPREAVPVVTALLKKEDWPALSRYYDLAGSAVKRDDLVSGRFFLRTDRPEAAHAAGFWRYRHPFAPGFQYAREEPGGAPDTTTVVVAVAIDQGGGMVQRGESTFKMRRSAPGWQILPDPASEAPAAARHTLSWTGYDGTGDRERAEFTLDGAPIGKGAAGLEALRKRMAGMPAGTRVLVEPYYGDPGGVRRVPPFDEAELIRCSREHRVEFCMPGGE